MSRRHQHASTMDAIARFIFPEIPPAQRRKHLQFLILSLELGLLFCAVLVVILWLLH
jgi:hypothetical protein